MKILVCQPIHEDGIYQLECELSRHPSVDVVLFPEGYLANDELVPHARDLARTHGVALILGYRDKGRKNRALIVNGAGEVILDRAKTPMNENLYSPSSVEYNGITIGYLLCRELLQGFQGFKDLGIHNVHFVAHPIGVGMFSEEQFDEWIAEAKRIAVAYKTMVIGTSHADGSFRNCGTSIPIAYCVDSDGEPIFISKNDVRPRIVDTCTKVVEILQPNGAL